MISLSAEQIPARAERILARARSAQPAWAALSASRRCEILGVLRRQIALECESIAQSIARETSKPLLDALSGDVMVTLEIIRYYESQAPKILRSRRIGKPAFLFSGALFESHFEPHGVALIFGPSNYPFQLSMIPLVTALIAGNAVLLKCSDHTPATAVLITKLCTQAGFPPGLVQVCDDGPEEAATLIDAQPDIIFFTGSSRHGRMMAERAAKHLIPVILELGGKDACLVFADCNFERAIEGITYGAFSNSGRVCVGIKRAYVEASIYDEFVDRLKQRITNLCVATGPDADLFPISGDTASILRTQVEDALARGATLHCPQDSDLIGCVPMLLTSVPAEARILTEESFGPVLCVAPFNDEVHALKLANLSAFALSGSVWTRDRERARRVATQLSAGSCAVNDVIRVIANPYAAFGGNRLSGYGRYHGPEGLRAFSRLRTIMIAGDRRAREVNWFPFTSQTSKKLARLLRFRHGQNGLVARLNRTLLPLVLCTLLSLGVHGQINSHSKLTIDVRLTPSAHGELAYLIFNSHSGFPGDAGRAIRHGFLPIRGDAQLMHIDIDLPPGTYAVSVYEDLNDNHRLDRNLIGIPREPVGVSNNPPARMGPPRFNECSIRVGAAAETVNINMVPAS